MIKEKKLQKNMMNGQQEKARRGKKKKVLIEAD
jgi:hypothetical protein